MSKKILEKIAIIRQYFKSGRAVTSFIALVVSFCMMVVSSVAWLTTNRTLKSEGMGMGLDIDDTSAVYKVYMYDLNERVGTDKTVGDGDTKTPLNIASLKMNEYDTIFVVQNQYTPVFAQIQISRNSSNSEMPMSGTVYITIYRDSSIDKFDKNGELSNNISSVIRFSAIIDTTKADIAITDADSLYKHINPKTRFDLISGYTANTASSKTFIPSHGEGVDHSHEKDDEITIELNYTKDNWYTDQGIYKLNVYLYMSYDTQLIDCFMNQRADEELSLNETTYDFANDLKNVSVSYTQSN